MPHVDRVAETAVSNDQHFRQTIDNYRAAAIGTFRGSYIRRSRSCLSLICTGCP